MKIVGFGFYCGYGNGHYAARFDRNHMVLILQNTLDSQEFIAVDHSAIALIKVRVHDDIGDSRFVFEAQEDKSFRGSRPLPRNHASCHAGVLAVWQPGHVETVVRAYLTPRFGNEIAEDIKPLDIQRWLKSLHDDTGLAWTTISKMRCNALRFFPSSRARFFRLNPGYRLAIAKPRWIAV